jgi:hypothetical protein
MLPVRWIIRDQVQAGQAKKRRDQKWIRAQGRFFFLLVLVVVLVLDSPIVSKARPEPKAQRHYFL